MNNFYEKPFVTSENNFGEVVRTTGPIAKANPIRFSTKYQDDESDLNYYGYRYYKASTGTWVNRDPIDDIGFPGDGPVGVFSVNTYMFVNNGPLAYYDAAGLFLLPPIPHPYFDSSVNVGPCGTYVCTVWGMAPGKKPDPTALAFCVGVRKAAMAAAALAGNFPLHQKNCHWLNQCYQWYAP